LERSIEPSGETHEVGHRALRVRGFVADLKRRRAYHVAAAYVVAAWVAIEVSTTVAEAPFFVIALVAMGFPVVLVAAWVLERKRQGVADRAVQRLEAPDPGGAQAAAKVARDGDNVDRVGLIVLPFRPLRPDAETDFLGFALPDAISSSLTALRSIVVRSSLASFRFGDSIPDPAEVARTTGADLIVSGTLLRAEDRIRVIAQLTQGASGELLWSRTCDVGLGDLLEVQAAITQAIVGSLRHSLTDGENQDLGASTPSTARAYEYFLRANQVAYQTNQWKVARELYRESLREDPLYAPAWARLGRVYRLIAKFSLDETEVSESRRLAHEAFRRAVEIRPDLPITVSLYSQFELELGRPTSAMVRLLTHVGRSGGDPDLFAGLVQVCRYCGLLDGSKAAHLRARALDPRVVTSVGHTYWALGEYEKSLEETFGDIGYLPGLALASLGLTDEAIRSLREHEQSGSETRVHSYIFSLRALLEGRRDECLAALEAASVNLIDGHSVYYLARTYARLGEVATARERLAHSVNAGFFCYPLMASDPWLDPVREDPGVAAVLGQASQLHLEAAAAYREAGGEELLGPPTASVKYGQKSEPKGSDELADLRPTS